MISWQVLVVCSCISHHAVEFAHDVNCQSRLPGVWCLPTAENWRQPRTRPETMSLPKSYTSSTHGGEIPDDHLADYKAVFPSEVAKFPYEKKLKVARIARNRALLGGALFFDKLCSEHLDRVENSMGPPSYSSRGRGVEENP